MLRSIASLRSLLIAAALGVVGSSAQASTTPVFQYTFPDSFAGGAAGTAVTDQSGAGNDGATVATVTTNAAVPPGAPGGAVSIKTNSGGILTNATSLLDNPDVQAAGGFTYNVSFLWDGTDSSSFGHAEKILDYAGTESLQLTTSAGSAQLQMRFDDSVNAVSTTILPNTWYNVEMVFDSNGNPLDGGGNLPGTAYLIVNGGTPISAAATKTIQGDGLNRPIGVGQLGANFGYLVGFKGEIYNPSVSLGADTSAVPEPGSLALLSIGGLAMLRRRRA